MMSDRQKQISLLVRMNRGRLMMPKMLGGLSKAVGYSVQNDDLLDLIESDRILSDLSSGYGRSVAGAANTFRRIFAFFEEVTVDAIVIELAAFVDEEQALLCLRDSKFCGAARVKASTVLRNFRNVLDLDGDSVRLLATDRSWGLMIDQNPDDFDEAFELAVWGERLAKRVKVLARRPG